MAYITYDNYKELGGTADETAFKSLLVRAEARINYVTFHRIDEENLPANIEYLTKDLIDIFFDLGVAKYTNITSYDNGIEKTSYSSNGADADKKINSYIAEFFSDRPDLIYRGY